MGGSLSLLPSKLSEVPHRLYRERCGGARVEVLEGDFVQVLKPGPAAAAGQRMRVVRMESQAMVVVRAEGALGGEEAYTEFTMPLEQLQLVCEGVTLARQQMRQLLALYLAHCARPDIALLCREHGIQKENDLTECQLNGSVFVFINHDLCHNVPALLRVLGLAHRRPPRVLKSHRRDAMSVSSNHLLA